MTSWRRSTRAWGRWSPRRLPRNPIGWIFLAIGLTLALNGVAYGYADHAIYGGADLPLQQ